MKYIKNGKVVLDGTIRECDLEEKLLRALEIIIEKKVNVADDLYERVGAYEWRFLDYDEYLIGVKYLDKEWQLEQSEFELLKEVLS